MYWPPQPPPPPPKKKKPGCVFVKQECPRRQQSSKLAVFSIKVTVKVTKSLTLVLFERVSLVEYEVSISYGSNVMAKVRNSFLPQRSNRQTDKQTDRQDNKRPKGPHIVHLNTMCSLFEESVRAAILFFRLARKNTNLVEDVEILLPVAFRWIPFSHVRRKVENVLANQRPGRPSCFPIGPKTQFKLDRGRWDLASCQVSLNSVQRIQRRSRKYLSQSEARAAILFFFPDRPEKHKLGRGRWDVVSCQVSLNSIEPFQSKSRKCLSQSETRKAILFFRSARKTQT